MYDSEGPFGQSTTAEFRPDFSKTLPAMQEIGFQTEVAPWSAMARKLVESQISANLQTFVTNAKMAMEANGITSESELARIVSRATKGARSPTTKTINNALNIKHSTLIGTLDAMAQGLSVPLWMMFVPGLTKEDLASPNRERFAAMVRNYIECDDEGRQDTEAAAKLFASRARAKRG